MPELLENIPDDVLAELKKRYSLDYHVDGALRGHGLVDFTDQNVLEIGGTLPKDFVFEQLQPKQWIGIEAPHYYRLAIPGRAEKVDDSPHSTRFEDVKSPEDLPDYSIIVGRAEDIPPSFYGQFDRIFSIATFEHLTNFPLALDRMFNALRPGGKMFSVFSPIWSAHNGHHLHQMYDKSGREFSYKNSPIPPWSHLLMSQFEMYEFLRSHTDDESASIMAEHIYQLPVINRLFTEDYFNFFKYSKFIKGEFIGIPGLKTDEKTQKQLENRYPNYKHFSNHGLCIVAERPETNEEIA